MKRVKEKLKFSSRCNFNAI